MFISVRDFYGSGHGKMVWRWKIITCLDLLLKRNRRERKFFSLSWCFKNFCRGLEAKFKAEAVLRRPEVKVWALSFKVTQRLFHADTKYSKALLGVQ